MQKMRVPYTKIAYFIGGTGVTALLVSVFFYGLLIEGNVSNLSADWGTFGDFVGGMAGTVIALATLIALVMTLQLQATELEETRRALQDQAKATREQLDNVRQYEERRIQPLLKAEWFQDRGRPRVAHWRITNIGLGPCFMELVEVYVNNERVGFHDFNSAADAHAVWTGAFEKALPGDFPGGSAVRIGVMTDFRRMLASLEHQQVLSVTCKDDTTARRYISQFETVIRPEIVFRSLSKRDISTAHQDELFFDRITL